MESLNLLKIIIGKLSEIFEIIYKLQRENHDK